MRRARRGSSSLILRSINRHGMTVVRPALTLGFIGATMAGKAFAADPAWQITPTIGVQELYTSNSQGSGTNPQADLVTQISPGLSLVADTPHTNATINYAPTFNHYSLGTTQDNIDQNLNGSGKIVPFGDNLTIDFVVYATEEGSTGNRGFAPTSLLVPQNDKVLYYIGNLAPHYHNQIRDIAVLDVYYKLNSANTSQEGVTVPGQTSLSNSTLQQDARMTLAGGSRFGSLIPTLSIDHIVSTGSGPNNSSTNDNDTLQFEYHLNHEYSLTGYAGYQNIQYPATSTTSAYSNAGPTWNLGFRATPNPSSTLSLGYGLQQGIYTPDLEMNYALGQRTTLVATYIVTIQNQLQSALQNVQFLTHDAFGNPIDSRTGLPFSGVNQTFASQNVLFRDKPLLLSINHELSRSGVGLTLTYEQRDTVTGIPESDTAWGASVSYSRVFSPNFQGSFDFGFTDHNTAGTETTGGGRTKILNADALLTYNINEKTIATMRENFFKTISSIQSSSTTTNEFVLGLTRGF